MRLLLIITIAATSVASVSMASGRESERYYAAVEYACGQDPQRSCVRELTRLCGKPAARPCMDRNKRSLDAASERGFSAVRRRMEGR